MTRSVTSHRSAGSERLSPAGDRLEQIEGRWTLHILLCLRKGAHRFSDLRAAIPHISSNVLTERIRSLESAGLIERQHLPPPSASNVYVLAASEAGLKPALDALDTWLGGENSAR